MLDGIKSILNAITSLFNVVASIVDFLVTMVQDLLVIVDMLGKFVVELPVYFIAFMPPGVTPLLMVLLSVTIIYRVTGRD